MCDSPDEIPRALIPCPRSTSTGEVLSISVPSPSCPNSLEPQHRTEPSSNTVHVWYEPAETPTAFLPSGMDDFSGSRLGVLDPSPSCPLLLSPQQLTEPSSRIAQECDAPDVICSRTGTLCPDSAHLQASTELCPYRSLYWPAGQGVPSAAPGDGT